VIEKQIKDIQLFVYTFEDDEMNNLKIFRYNNTALLMMNSDLTEKISGRSPKYNFTGAKPSQLRIDRLIIVLNSLSRAPQKRESKCFQKQVMKILRTSSGP
jgi:hypothetical protein